VTAPEPDELPAHPGVGSEVSRPETAGGEGRSRAADQDAPGRAGTVDLSQKPVLEWTTEDWERWISGPAPAADAPAVAPPVAGTGSVTPRTPEHPAPDGHEDDDWMAAGDHPWWGSASDPVEDAGADVADRIPVEDAAADVADRIPVEDAGAVAEPPTRVEPGVAPPAGPARPAGGRVPPPAPSRPVPPGRPPARGDLAPRRPAVSFSSHRVRSALGLLGLAVAVGTMAAALIIVGAVVINVALRQAVG